MEITGKYTSATLYLAENPVTCIDQYALSQLTMLCNNETLEDSRIRIMPDVHAGKVGTIGFTASVGNKIMPLLIGIDIGCGMTVAKITKGKAEWQRLDKVIRDSVPSGSHLRKSIHNMAVEFDYGRKNWYIDVSIIPESENICTDKDIKFERFHCGGNGGQNVIMLESVLFYGTFFTAPFYFISFQ